MWDIFGVRVQKLWFIIAKLKKKKSNIRGPELRALCSWIIYLHAHIASLLLSSFLSLSRIEIMQKSHGHVVEIPCYPKWRCTLCVSQLYSSKQIKKVMIFSTKPKCEWKKFFNNGMRWFDGRYISSFVCFSAVLIIK